jgi:SPP1 family predicted phage head-tail adaptor
MREKIIIQKSCTGIDKNGNHVPEWQNYYSCSAYANNMSGQEYWAAAQVNSETDMYFVIRYCSEVKNMTTDRYRILFHGRIYNIIFIDNV